MLCAGRVACWGYLDGTSAKCPFKCAPGRARRYRFALPDDVAAMDFVARRRGAGAAGGGGDAAAAPAKGGAAKKKRKAAGADAAAARAPPPLRGGPLRGLALRDAKPALGAAAARAASAEAARPPPARRAPQAGSPILAVHGAYKQTGRFHRAKVHVAADGVTAYNAHFSQV